MKNILENKKLLIGIAVAIFINNCSCSSNISYKAQG